MPPTSGIYHVLATSQCVDCIPVVFAKLINVLREDHGHVFLMMAPGQFLNAAWDWYKTSTPSVIHPTFSWQIFIDLWLQKMMKIFSHSKLFFHHQTVPLKTSSHRSHVWPKDWALNRPGRPGLCVAKVPLQCQGFSQAMHGTQSEAMVHLTGGATETMNALSVLNKLKESKVYNMLEKRQVTNCNQGTPKKLDMWCTTSSWCTQKISGHCSCYMIISTCTCSNDQYF